MADTTNNIGLRLNNPGNIKDPATGQFRVFSSPEEGNNALIHDLSLKVTGGSSHITPMNTLKDFAKVWAPASDRNNPDNYAKILASHLGVAPETPIGQLKDRLPDFAQAIKVAEGTTGIKANSSGPLSVSDFAAKIKAKYPAYKDLNDTVLVQKIVAKYPQYQSKIAGLPPMASQALAIPDERAQLQAQGQPVSVNPDKAQPSFVGNMIRGIIKPVARYGLTLGRAAEGLVGAGPQDLTQAVHSNYLGDITPTGQQGTTGQRIKDVLGNTAEVASNFIGGGGAGSIAKAGLKGAIKEGAIQGLKAGAIGGGLQGAGQALTENKSIGRSLLEGGIGAVAGGAAGGLLGGATGAAGAGIRKIAGAPLTDEAFASKVNKALPVLKKDVNAMPQKVANIKTAFSDIVANKDTIGLTNSSGKPRLPKNFVETIKAQNTRLPQIYKAYTEKLSGVDAQKFNTDIKSSIKNQISSINNQLKKENSLDGRRALTKIKTELGSLRDTSPLGIQNYIQSINQRVKPLAPGGSLTTEQIKYANLGGEMRKLLDTSINKLDGKGYQELRNIYAAHKALQSQLMMAAKKEINNVPGFTDKLVNAGMTAEGINFLLTHDPHALVIGGVLKLSRNFIKRMNSPQYALQTLFKDVEKNYKISSPSKPQTMNASAKIEPKNMNMVKSISK